MGKAVGSEPLGSLYSAGKVRRRREWRGLRDTMYDYFRWLGILGVLLRFIAKPRNFRGFLRYRWMVNYLAVPMMMDRVTEGLRGPHLRIAHLEYGRSSGRSPRLWTSSSGGTAASATTGLF